MKCQRYFADKSRRKRGWFKRHGFGNFNAHELVLALRWSKQILLFYFFGLVEQVYVQIELWLSGWMYRLFSYFSWCVDVFLVNWFFLCYPSRIMTSSALQRMHKSFYLVYLLGLKKRRNKNWCLGSIFSLQHVHDTFYKLK